MGSILDRARTDAKNIINAVGFQLDIQIFNPDKSFIVESILLKDFILAGSRCNINPFVITLFFVFTPILY